MAMKITKVTLDNICCFEHIELSFGTAERPRPWTLILGDNGVGKTTLLRSIALALCEETSASALYQSLYGDLVRIEAGKQVEAKVTVNLVASEKPRDDYVVETTIERQESGETRLHQRTEPKDEFPWDDIFVCGYGAGRRAFGAKVLSEYSATDALEPLFNYEIQLQNLELMLRRIKDDASIPVDHLLNRVCHILGLEPGSMTLKFGGPEVRGEWGRFLPMGQIADGYSATMAWLFDMLGWILYFDPELVDQPQGIVLLDEIEQHLHPKLQKEIFRRLQEQFPKLQFVTTSHSPLCAIGTSELEDVQSPLILLSWDDDRVVRRDQISPPRWQRADQVLTSYLFGLASTRSRDVAGAILRYSQLRAKKKLAKQETEELGALSARLNRELGSPETELQRRVEEAVRRALDGMAQGWLDSMGCDDKAVEMETRRQVRELFGMGQHDGQD